MPLSKLSLRSRLLILVGAAYLPAVGLTLATIHRDREEAFNTVRSHLSRMLSQASQDNDLVLRTAQRAVYTWAQSAGIIYGSRAMCEAEISRLSGLSPSVMFLSRINVAGDVDCGFSMPAGSSPMDQHSRIAESVMAVDSAIVVRYLAAQGDSVPVLPFLIALRDSTGAYRGMLGVGFRLAWFGNLAANPDLPRHSRVLMVDSSGLLLASLPAKPANVGKVVPELSTLVAQEPVDSGVVLRKTPDGRVWLVAYHILHGSPNSRTRLYLELPGNVAYASAMQQARLRILFLTLAGVAALAIAWFGIGRFVLRDMNAILSATERLGAGDLSARTGLGSAGGEVGRLAKSFDTMASQLEVRQDRLRQAERMESLGRLAGGVAHDFNNLLTAIVGSADLALSELPPDHPIRDELEMIKTSASRSGSLTRQLLDFSRRVPAGLDAQPLEGIVRNAVSLLMRVMPASVSVSVHTNSTRLVRLDSGRVEQAILNLAVNARDAMSKGGLLSIELDDVNVAEHSAPDGPPPGSWVRLRVRDTGQGMSPEVLKRVFEPFYTTKEVGLGTGLGLTMVYGTVQAHDGHLQVDSILDGGTTVTMWFPEATSAPLETEVSSNIVPPSGSMDVLVAEDQPEVRKMLQRVLERAGFKVTAVTNGQEAIDQIENRLGNIDILITDYDMPHQRGDTVALKYRSSDPGRPLILISGFAQNGWPVELLESRATVVLNKPFTASELLTAIYTARNFTPPSGTLSPASQ